MQRGGARFVVQISRRTRRAARRAGRRCPSSSATGCGARAARRPCGRRGRATVFDVVDARRLRSTTALPAGAARARCSGKKCGSRAATIAADREEAGLAVVGMQAVRLPRIVTEHDVGPDVAGSPRTAAARAPESLPSSPSTQRRNSTSVAPSTSAGVALLAPRGVATSAREVGVGVPGALRAVGADAQRDVGAGVGPLGERGAAAELDVVGVGADRERTLPAPGDRR